MLLSFVYKTKRNSSALPHTYPVCLQKDRDAKLTYTHDQTIECL